MRRVVPIVIVILLSVTAYEVTRRGSAPAKPGGPAAAARSLAPNFTLQDLNGQPLALSDFRGKVVLLDFWATWCAPCRTEIPHLVEFQEKYREQGFQVVGISMDDGPKPVREFYQEFRMNYPVAMGNDKIADAYGGVLGLPVTLLIGRDGLIQAKYTGVVEMAVVEEKIKTLLQMN
jgi:thiol-disulfide isomerase/thioredoxin